MMKSTLTALACLALQAPVLAQEFVSKAPTAADWAALAKLPDLNGVWERGPASAPVRVAGATAAPPPGGRARGSGLSFTPKYEAMRAAAAKAPAPEDNETANCLPPGMPGIMGQPYPMEFLLTPGKVTIVIEAYTQVRHIYTDGRPLPAEPNPKFFGTSIGHWEGDTLVAETVGFNDLVVLARGVGHSDKMKIVERFRLTAPDTMTIETTISDPDALTVPNTTSTTLRRHREWTISEYVCEENNRNFVDPTGKSGINLKE
jgi:hypothetical protein